MRSPEVLELIQRILATPAKLSPQERQALLEDLERLRALSPQDYAQASVRLFVPGGALRARTQHRYAIT